MKKIIISADDFGLTEGVTKGIAESINNGIVSRTSAMMCTGGAQWISKYKEGLDGKIGLHLQLTDGSPLLPATQVSSLLNGRGLFARKRPLIRLETLNPEELEAEWEAQMQALLDTGVKPSHIDTHHNVHRYPKVFNVFLKLAIKYQLPARALSPEMSMRLKSHGLLGAKSCLRSSWDEHLTDDLFIMQVLGAFRQQSNQGAIEVMCHPGYVDEALKERSHYLAIRERELRVFCDPNLPAKLKKHHIQVESFDNATVTV